jgi:hypothetical protein
MNLSQRLEVVAARASNVLQVGLILAFGSGQNASFVWEVSVFSWFGVLW